MSFKTVDAEVNSCNVGVTGNYSSVNCSTLIGLKSPFTCGVNI